MLRLALACVLTTALATSASALDLKDGLQPGTPEIESVGPLAFGPEGILFIGDPKGAAIYAIDTGDAGAARSEAKFKVTDIDKKVADLLGTTPQDVLINDLAVNPASGNVFLSVSRGRGPDALPVLLKVDASGKVSEVELKNVPHAKAVLPNPIGREANDRRANRMDSITDLAYLDGEVYVAGLSNEDFDSRLRSIAFPFQQVGDGTNVGIYHGSHGRFETKSPVRTFVPFDVAGEPHLLAAYTCTPLVKIPVAELKPGAKVKGTTIAELGNRNRPLDMIVYQKDGKTYVLMANSSRGVMKINTEGIDEAEAIEKPVPDKAGTTYETVAELKGVEQLDRLNDEYAVVLVRAESGSANLDTVPLP
jgi:hypothetical protein